MNIEAKKIRELKKTILKASYFSKEGHIPSAFSILDILYVLYSNVLNVNAKNPGDENRDRFILSKGHASLGLYAVLAERGFINSEELETFGKFSSRLGGHPDCNKIPGVEASTGSLGHGFPIALGIAMALKIKKSSSRVFVIVGDGECNEGTIWETALLAVNHNLDNITCIIDYNHSNDRALLLGSLAEKFKSFGWSTFEVDGHCHEQLGEALKKRDNQRPIAIIANTIKGKGILEMENNPAWHHKFPSENEIDEMIKNVS
jgi:transketolase